MILLIDNYDSFTWNLVHYLSELGAEVEVKRNDELRPADALGMRPDAIVLSPGPCNPDRAGICLDLINSADGRVPILGVCLGHQAIGQAYGGRIERAPLPMHGKLSRIRHTGKGVFRGLENDFEATRYHSLTIDSASMPDCLEVTATTDGGVIMGVMHREHPVHGVQFHPESIASQHGHALLRNFLKLARESVAAPLRRAAAGSAAR
jgi:anthranilate synthase component II